MGPEMKVSPILHWQPGVDRFGTRTETWSVWYCSKPIEKRDQAMRVTRILVSRANRQWVAHVNQKVKV